jgi:hypothetical protein
MKFASTNNKTGINLNIGYDNNTNEEIRTTKFLSLQTENNINWKKHNEYIISKTKFNMLCHENRHFKIKV